MAKNEKKAIIVLGVHRSGTSVLTRVINICGIKLPENIIPKTSDNETGFWESDDIIRLNEELLCSVNSSWDDIYPINQNEYSEDSIYIFEKKGLDILNRNFSCQDIFIIKDPRICRVLPQWVSLLEKFNAEPLIIIPIRNPLEVCSSLNKRDGFTKEISLALWFINFIDAERNSRKLKRVFISYERLLTHTEETLNKIEESLNVKWKFKYKDISDEIREFVSKKFKHYNISEYFLKDVEYNKYDLYYLYKIYDKKNIDYRRIDRIYNIYVKNTRIFSDYNKYLVAKNNKNIEEIKKIYSTISWKITYPLRAFRNIFIIF